MHLASHSPFLYINTFISLFCIFFHLYNAVQCMQLLPSCNCCFYILGVSTVLCFICGGYEFKKIFLLIFKDVMVLNFFLSFANSEWINIVQFCCSSWFSSVSVKFGYFKDNNSSWKFHSEHQTLFIVRQIRRGIVRLLKVNYSSDKVKILPTDGNARTMCIHIFLFFFRRHAEFVIFIV